MDIKKDIKDFIADRSLIDDIEFEVSNVVIYTKNKNFFLDNSEIIKNLVSKEKKRIEVRLEPSLLMDEKEAENKIKEMGFEEAAITKLWFDAPRSIVTIEAEHPEIISGDRKAGINRIKEETGWSVVLARSPLIKSDIVGAIREMLYDNSKFRRKMLNEVGENIYNSKFEVDDKYWVRISALGAFRHVGRSAVLVQTPISSVLLDAGVDVSNSREPVPRVDAPEFDISKLNAVVITHSHLDHCGFLPVLYKYGYKGPVYSTAPTRDVMTLLHLDYINLASKTNGKLLFDVDDIKNMLKHSITIPFHEVTDITPDIRITLHNAGHILGSAMIHLNIGNGFYNVLYTGDFKYENSKTLNRAETQFERVETLIMESTYGGDADTQPVRSETEKFFFDIISKTVANNGKVLVPVLGVGRAQEIMLLIEEWQRYGLLPEVPVIVDGMLWDVTAIYTVYPEFMNSETRNRIITHHNNPFLSPIFKHTVSEEERQQVLSGGPAILLATSGMLNGGPSVSYFANLCEDEKNAIVLVSYQGVGTLGRTIQNGGREVDIELNGKLKHFTVNALVYSIEGFSGHSDRKQLERFVSDIRPKPRKVIIGHGEEGKILELSHYVRRRFGIETYAPHILDALRLK
ncbi:MAG: beta-lactamase domain protein [Candidatus Parvarchaeum acidophilus ARMAN-5]|jgi:KH/beta-lactamase-domain protein|uniref:Transcription termination factor FttA n=2 Tax=Candidatus Parvarchaeum acidophilus ARMAN-5 TaxID=662762 RepID=D6GUJ7_PARA5|nr:MAG: beta-lactamase domain protein [Candidatus Parvarchaeum acidophilus ARMAN-5]